MGSILDNVVSPNAYNFTDSKLNNTQPVVTNNLGRAVVFGEWVYLGGYFGNVVEQAGIANGATGRIETKADREIRSQQVEATDTFTIANTLYFEPGGSSAAGTFVDTATGTTVAVGIITGEEGAGGAQTSVAFRPFVQKVDNANLDTRMTAAEADIAVEQAEPKILVQKITADASAGIAVTGLAENDEVVGMSVICTAANASGTLVLEDGAGDDITDGVACAVDKAVDYAAEIDDSKSTIPATGAKIISVGGTTANTRGIVVITYIPA